MVKKAAEMDWEGATLDVKTAFLNASLEEDDGEWIVIRPPHILVAQKFLEKDDVFLALKAVYGLRRSPRLWGKTRDKGLREMSLKVDGKTYYLQPLLSEPNMWKVVEDQELFEDDASRIEGLLMTYVDDLFIVACLHLVQAIIGGIRGLWATTQPEYVSSDPVRFLGMEISRVQGDTGVIWKVTQQSYVTDLLQKNPEVRPRKIPITRDQGLEIEEEEVKESITVEDIRRAQKVVGELLWTVTRSRPDAMFAVAKMGSGTLRCPRKVCEVGDQVKGYLKDTKGDGLMFLGDSGENDCLEVFTDASFGDQSYGCVMVLIHGSPVLWKCGKQGASSLSTAESELQEIIDGMTAGESTYAVGREVFGEMKRVLWTDSQSAMSIMSSEGGSWRTRHLRLKSAHARTRLLTGEWGIRHLPGERMISDIGTKPLTSTRILSLKKEMGMWVESKPIHDGNVEDENRPLDEGDRRLHRGDANVEQSFLEDLSVREKGIRAEKILRLLTVAAVLQVGRSDDPERPSEEGGDVFSFEMFMVVYTLAVAAVSALVTWAWLQRSVSSPSSDLPMAQPILDDPVADPSAAEERETPGALREVPVDQPEAAKSLGHVRNGDGSAESSDRGGVDAMPEQVPSASIETQTLWRGILRPRWRGEIEIRGRRIQSPRGFPVILTRFGDRYHDVETCSALSRSPLTRSPWCRECLAQFRGQSIGRRPTLWSRGPGQLVHVDEACDPDLRRFDYCQICQRGGR